MNKKHKSYHFSEINKFFHYVGVGSFIALLLGYFLLDKIINTGTRFFLCWTCVGILTVIVGIYFRIISGLGGVVTFVYMVATPAHFGRHYRSKPVHNLSFHHLPTKS